MVAGVFCMASMDVMAKILGHSIPVAQIVWLRFVSQALLVGGGLIIARRALFTQRAYQAAYAARIGHDL